MKKQWMPKEPLKAQKAEPKKEKEQRPAEGSAGSAGMAGLHHAIGNQAVQRLIAQRNGSGPTELDEETAGRIDRARSGGQALDGAVQEEMGQAMGYDFAGVRAHTSPEADDLSRELGAKAFTTGQDVFFREGTYDPASTAGRELIAHELTHVVQQGTGQRQEDEELVQAQEDPEEEELVQAQPEEEEEPVQMQEEQEEEELEEEELVQAQSDEEEEEEWIEP